MRGNVRGPNAIRRASNNATGPQLKFGATPGLGPHGGHTVSVCTADHAVEAAAALRATIERLKAGESQTLDAMEHYGNRRPRVERLVSAWNQGSGGVAAPVGKPDDPFIGASAEPRRRTRTPLTEAEVDAMRTARGQGVSVNALARRFGVHRATVWAKTR